MSSWFNPKTEKRTSPIQGRGLFARVAIRAIRHATEQRCGNALLERSEVLLETQHLRIDPVRHPAGQHEAACGDRLDRQQRMVEAAEPHADDQDQRQAQSGGQIRRVEAIAQRHAEAADAFDQHCVGLRAGTIQRIDDDRRLDAHCGLGRLLRVRVAAQRVGQGPIELTALTLGSTGWPLRPVGGG